MVVGPGTSTPPVERRLQRQVRVVALRHPLLWLRLVRRARPGWQNDSAGASIASCAAVFCYGGALLSQQALART